MTDVTTTEMAPPRAPTDPERARGSSGPAWWQIVAIVVVLCVVAGAVGWRIGRSDDSPPSASSVDVGFFYDMTAHHQQAIAMALIYLRNGNDPLLLAIAKEIVQYQSSEIGMMNEYLSQWNRAGNRPAQAMGWMQPPVDRDQMPGLATDAQMEQLANARGLELDNLFTQLMIEHHGGGVHMAAYAAQHAEKASTRRWAAQMDEGQRGEISEMNQWRRRHDLNVIVPPLAEFTPKVNADG